MDQIDRIRAFNRIWTDRIGLLQRSYLDSGLGLTEVRVLHDLAAGPVRARDLAQTLNLDEGYLSRLLARFERAGWVSRLAIAGDARARAVSLTPTGAAEVRRLVTASRNAVQMMLAEMPPSRRAALTAGLDLAATAFDDSPVVLRALVPGDAGWIIARHGALYAADEGFDATFEALVAEILATFLRGHDPERERGWIAVRKDQRLGSIFCVAGPDATAKLRLFLIEKSERGTGLAQTMLATCIAFAQGAGYPRMRLWTHESHVAAGRLYARNGFVLTESRQVRSFGQDLVEQAWERPL